MLLHGNAIVMLLVGSNIKGRKSFAMTIAQNFVRELNNIENPDYKDVALYAIKYDKNYIVRDLMDETGKMLDQDMFLFSDKSRCFVFYDSATCKYMQKACVTKKKWEDVFPDGKTSWEVDE